MQTAEYEDHDMTPFLEQLATAILCSVSAMVGAASFSVSPDIVAIIGASVGAFVMAQIAGSQNKSRWHCASVFLASLTLGSTIPGAIIYYYFPDSVARLPWHAWTILGLFSSLMGWPLVTTAFAIRDYFVKRRARWIETVAYMAESEAKRRLAQTFRLPPEDPTPPNPPVE